jgi:RHS repeat-associated protein
MRIDSSLYYVLKDHLGSASVVTNASGATVGEQRYYPFGETRLTTGSIFTDKLFTGQREMAGLGIYHYQARFYSPYINQFLSADTIVPGYSNPQNLNRYSYVTNNPLRYTDPTGHRPEDGYVGNYASLNCNKYSQYCNNGKPKSKQELVEMRKLKNQPRKGFIDEVSQIIRFGVEGLDLLDLVEDGMQWGRPVYRQIKYAIPLGGFEWGVDGGLQLYDDRKMNLTGLQRIFRSSIRGFESAAIDGLSTAVGSAAAAALQASIPVPVVPAGVGYIVGSYSTSAILDNFVTQVNPSLFSWLGLGGP